MNDTQNEVEVAKALVAKALGVSTDQISAGAKMYEIPIWDSLGQLSIIIAIEESLQVEITEASTFESLSCVAAIAVYIAQATTTISPTSPTEGVG
jgi:acyl carrier protein